MHAVSITRELKRCEDKVRLVQEYDIAAAELSRAVNFLNRQIGVLPKSDYDHVRSFTEEARLKFEQARYNLEKHITEHGC